MSDVAILADLRPCGYVLSTHHYQYFALECIHCQKKYGHWKSFLQHLKHQHGDQEMQWLDEAICEPWPEETVLDEGHDMPKVCENVETEVTKPPSPLKCEADEGLYLAETQFHTEDVRFDGRKEDCATVQTQIRDTDVVNGAAKAKDFQLDFSQVDATTSLFIELYKDHPCLWNPADMNYSNSWHREQTRRKLVKCLNAQNASLTLSSLKKAIAQLHRLHDDISMRFEEGLDVSEIEASYWEQCNFLKCVATAAPSDTESEDIDLDLFSDEFETQSMSDETNSSNSMNNFANLNAQQQHKTANRNRFAINFSHQNKSTCDFIQCYRDQPCLWDPEHVAFNNSDKRREALTAIKKFFWKTYKIQLTDKSLASAIVRLSGFYRRCCRTKREMNNVRKFYFQQCAFMADISIDDEESSETISTNKIQFGNVSSFVLHFIKLYESHPVLWDYSHPDYSGFNARRKAYEEITSRLLKDFAVEFNKEELCDAIHRLKQHYYSVGDKQRQNKPLTKSDLVYLERCKFLPANIRKFQCHMCGRSLRTETTLQVHLQKEHNIGQLPHKCGYCEQRFTYRTTMKEHEVRVHTKQYEFFCRHCTKGFANERDMELHELVHTGERNCVCEHCDKSFRLKHQLMEHVRVVHERVRRFKCSMCPKDYLRKQHLDDHVRTHLNIRDKICGTCGKSFTNFHTLFRHKQLHSEVKRYECKVCGDRFHQLVGLNGHMKRRHKIMNNTDIEKEAESCQDTDA